MWFSYLNKKLYLFLIIKIHDTYNIINYKNIGILLNIQFLFFCFVSIHRQITTQQQQPLKQQYKLMKLTSLCQWRRNYNWADILKTNLCYILQLWINNKKKNRKLHLCMDRYWDKSTELQAFKREKKAFEEYTSIEIII